VSQPHIERLSRPVRAREEQADKLFREIIEIAYDASNDYVTTSDGKRIVDHENINRSRLGYTPQALQTWDLDESET
jgi:hypothetical protein